DAHVWGDRALLADRALVPYHRALGDRGMRADLAALADHRTAHLRPRPEVRVRVDDAVLGLAELPDHHVVPEHRVAADRSRPVDRAVVADHGRPLDLLDVLRERALADVDVVAETNAGNLQLDLAVERVTVRFLELGDVPDVLPVPVRDPAVER